MLASHFHDEIVRQAVTAPLLIVAGAVLAVAGVVWRARRPAPVLLAVGLLMAAVGLYRLAEVPALRHNHLCHAHNFNPCSGDNAHDEDGHTHRFGRRAARPDR
jgi:hypothetical protein